MVVPVGTVRCRACKKRSPGCRKTTLYWYRCAVTAPYAITARVDAGPAGVTRRIFVAADPALYIVTNAVSIENRIALIRT